MKGIKYLLDGLYTEIHIKDVIITTEGDCFKEKEPRGYYDGYMEEIEIDDKDYQTIKKYIKMEKKIDNLCKKLF